MPRTLLFALLVAAGCGAKPQDRIVGTWELDKEAMRNREAVRRLPERDRELALAEIASHHMTIVITGDTIEVDGEPLPQAMHLEGTYEVASSDGSKLVLRLNGETVGVTVDGDKLTFENKRQRLSFSRTPD